MLTFRLRQRKIIDSTNRLSRKGNSDSITKNGMANAAVNIRHKVFAKYFLTFSNPIHILIAFGELKDETTLIASHPRGLLVAASPTKDRFV